MAKNLFLLGLLTWVSMTYAKHPVAHENIGDAQNFKIEKSTRENEAKRSFAGEKIKKKKNVEKFEESPDSFNPSEADSEVRYWQYSE